jgi:capsular polysaccharide biosynthesis protein
MDAVVTELPPTAAPVSKYVVELVDERAALRETPNVLWKSARTQGKETGLWSRYLPDHLANESHLVRVKEAWHLPVCGAVIDSQARLFSSSVAAAGNPGFRLEEMPGLRAKRGRLMFYPDPDLQRLEAASVFCNWPGQFNYAHFLLESMTALAALDDMGALERYPPIAPPLDAWRRDLVALFLGKRAGLLRQVDARMVRLDEGVFSSLMGGFMTAPTAALMLVRERLLSQALATVPRVKASRRVYFTRSDARRSPGHKRLYTALREQGFVIVDPVKLSPIEQILLVARARVIIGPTAAALANALFAPAGTRIVEIQSSAAKTGWVRRLCETVGLRWSGYACPPLQDDLPLSRVYSDVVYEENISVEALMASLAAPAEV